MRYATSLVDGACEVTLERAEPTYAIASAGSQT
jgi:hypothetical protein